MVQDHDRFIGIGNVKQSGYLAKEIFHELLGYVDDLEERVSKLEASTTVTVASSVPEGLIQPKPVKKATAPKNTLKTAATTVKKESESVPSTPSKRPVKKNVKV